MYLNIKNKKFIQRKILDLSEFSQIFWAFSNLSIFSSCWLSNCLLSVDWSAHWRCLGEWTKHNLFMNQIRLFSTSVLESRSLQVPFWSQLGKCRPTLAIRLNLVRLRRLGETRRLDVLAFSADRTPIIGTRIIQFNSPSSATTDSH